MAHGYPDYKGDESSSYPLPEWAARFGMDRTLTGSIVFPGIGWQNIIVYNVPAGLTLYIKSLLSGNSLGARKRVQILSGVAILLDHYHAEPLAKEWSVPLPFATGVVLTLRAYTGVADGSTYTANLWGWEE